MSQRLSNPLLLVRGLCKSYAHGIWPRRDRVRALDDVGLMVRKGTTTAIVGRSGSGKSTLAMCIAGLDRPDRGEIWLEDQDLAKLSFRELRKLRPALQLVQQDSGGALNPRFTAQQIIEEPLRIQEGHTNREQSGFVEELMLRVGLLPEWKDRRPNQFSGGQRQRLAIARALSLRPQLLILDEPFTGLDLSVKGQIVNLLIELQTHYRLTYVYISHDLSSVRHFADDVVVIDGGKVVARQGANNCFDSAALMSLRWLCLEQPCLVRGAAGTE